MLHYIWLGISIGVCLIAVLGGWRAQGRRRRSRPPFGIDTIFNWIAVSTAAAIAFIIGRRG